MQHYPVMYREIGALMAQTSGQWFIDCTLGMGGHTRHLLESCPSARVLGIDVDDQSLAAAKTNLQQYADRVEYHRLNFLRLFEEVDLSNKEISGLLVDPGVSVVQLKDAQRGFSHSLDARLDMRKDRNSELTAHHIINTYSEKQMTDIFETYGEIRKAAGLAKKIKEARLFGSMDSTVQLAGIIEKYYNWKPKKGRTHPAANVFQALRIVVNNELDGVREFLEKAVHHLPGGARIVFLSFHSVEDRMAKQTFIRLRDESRLTIIKPFPTFPSDSEVAENLPSRSAKLRAGDVT